MESFDFEATFFREDRRHFYRFFSDRVLAITGGIICKRRLRQQVGIVVIGLYCSSIGSENMLYT